MDRYEDAKLRIKEATDLVALIESYLPLRPRGRSLTALCPFHPENSPSFHVFRDTQHFHCFGCGKHGDVFTWLMERDGLSFREAMELLAERVGVDLEGVFQRGPRGGNAQQQRDTFATLQAVADFFHRALLTPAGAAARGYLERRGLADAIAGWKLGYHPDGSPAEGGLQRFAADNKLSRAVLEDAGLVKNGREIFAGRLMFPIVDERGRTVAFGGRVLPGTASAAPRGDYTPPKYLNSPESPWFSKRRVLFGLHAAKQAGQRRLVVMEGYTDVIACHLAGFPGAVAALGTAFTADHARIVERYAQDGVVLMFDGDRAGKQAAERALRELLNSRVDLRIAMVSDGDADAKDPADIVLSQPGEDEELVVERRARFADVIEAAPDALSVWFRLLRQRLDLTQAVHVETAARECAQLLAMVDVPVRRAAYLEQMARHLAVPTPALERMLRDAPVRRADDRDATGRSEQGAPQVRRAVEPKLSLLEQSERELLACVLAQPTLLIGLDLDEAAIETEAVAVLFQWATDGLALGREGAADLFRYLFTRAAEQPELRELLVAAHKRAAETKEPQEVLAGLMAGRRRVSGEAERRTLRQRLQQALQANDAATAAMLQREMMSLLRRERPRPGADMGTARRHLPRGDNPFLKASSGAAGGADPEPGDDL
ncbi:MAG: DNA primase [Planctomycetes bacterium]|nr:DNA primase [Planctomycetota bacterium]